MLYGFLTDAHYTVAHKFYFFSIARAAIYSEITYDDVDQFKLSNILKSHLKEYHYKQRARVRIFDSDEPTTFFAALVLFEKMLQLSSETCLDRNL